MYGLKMMILTQHRFLVIVDHVYNISIDMGIGKFEINQIFLNFLALAVHKVNHVKNYSRIGASGATMASQTIPYKGVQPP